MGEAIWPPGTPALCPFHARKPPIVGERKSVEFNHCRILYGVPFSYGLRGKSFLPGRLLLKNE